jgi:phosphoribosyl 1,2-cyclic phosphate phosphodiesterase
VTALPATHDPTVCPLLYAIQADGRSIFYGTDTGALSEETWQALHRDDLRFDVVILDHTYGDSAGESDHLNAAQFRAHITRMREEGLLAADAHVFAQHISHEHNPTHPELTAMAAQHGYQVAYDGLTV